MIYWLTGAIGSGKSTLGTALAASYPETFFIDGDFLLADTDKLPFEERLSQIKNKLIATCISYQENNQSAVIAYPVTKESVSLLRQKLGSDLWVIGIQSIPHSSLTRGYSEWEIKRQQEMDDCNGIGYADLLFTHPTNYLHDSLKQLKQQIDLSR